MLKIATLLTAAVALAGCGTVTRGTTEDVPVQVSPSTARVTTSLGNSCTGTCVIKAPRSKSFTVTASAPGYASQTVQVGTRDMANVGDTRTKSFLAGGLVGMGIDAANGATLDHYPNPVVISLRPAS